MQLVNLILVATTVLAMGVRYMAIGESQVPDATPAKTERTMPEPQCGELGAYLRQIDDDIPDAYRNDMNAVFDSDDWFTLRPSVLESAAQGFDAWSEQLATYHDTDIPRAARPWHRAYTEYIGLLSTRMTLYLSGGPFAIAGLENARTELAAKVTDGLEYGEELCGTEWTRNFN